MLRFKNGLLLGTMSSAGMSDTGGGGGGDAAAAAAAAATAAASAPDLGKLLSEKPLIEYLPDEYKTDIAFRDIKDFPGLVKGYKHAQSLVGLDKGRVLALPKDDDAKAWDGVYSQLGRPEKVDGYKLPKPEGGDYSADDKAFQSQVLPILHKAGLTQRQLDAIAPAWNALSAEALKASGTATQKAMADADATLTKEWGAAAGEKKALALDAMNYFAANAELKLGDGLKAALERKDANGNALGNDPALIKLFAHLGGQMKEDGLLGKGGAASGSALSPDEAKREINAKYADEKFMGIYTNKRDPGHGDAVKEMQRLNELAYPAAT